MTQPENKISNYFLIGNLHTAALVNKENASIDWLCLPQFDSPSVFGKLLGEDAGHFSLTLNENETIETAYEKETAIVQHSITRDDELVFELFDFMLPSEEREVNTQYLVREIVAKQDCTVPFDLILKPEYGNETVNLQTADSEQLKAHIHDVPVSIHAKKGEFQLNEPTVHIVFNIPASETRRIVLQVGEDNSAQPNEKLLEETREFWNTWISNGSFFEFCEKQMKRSAITLKLLQFAQTGAIVAAPTTSLPEEIGGVRNWDYRYTWMRDATFTIYSLMVAGYENETQSFLMYVRDILKNHLEQEEELHLMYTVDGKNIPQERELMHLEGFRNSKPVRIGNDAANQFQLDVFGAIIDSYYFSYKKHVDEHVFPKEYILYLAEQIEKYWKAEDNGIWEVREKSQYTYSKVMAWVGIDRMLAMSEHLGLSPEQRKKYAELQNEIEEWIWSNCYDEETGILSQTKDNTDLDATNFLFVLLKFLDKHDRRTHRIIDRTAEALVKNEVFVQRYKNDDGIEGDEGAFLLCSLWYISALAIVERVEEAEVLFKKLEDRFADSGLLPEEVDPKTGEYLGNFPQAFSHMGYIMAARYIEKYKSRAS